MIIRSHALAALLASALLLFGCAAAISPSPSPPGSPTAAAEQAKPAWQERWDKTVIEAKKEGSVVVYAIVGPSVRTELSQAFQKKYDIELQFIAGQPLEIANKLMAEKERGLRFADAINAGGGTLLSVLKPKGALAPLEPFLILPEVTNTKLWIGEQLFHDKDKTGVGFLTYYSRAIYRNSDIVKENDIASLGDLLNPRWKGKIVIDDPTVTSGGASWSAYLVRGWGLEQTKEYLRQLVKQEIVITREPRSNFEAVARGKYLLGIGARTDLMFEFWGMGAPIGYVKVKEMSKMTPGTGTISLPSQPAHPNAATLFLNWLLSREGQLVASKAWGTPSARVDVPREGFDPSFFPESDEKYFVQDEEDYLMQGKMLEINREIFAPLMR